MSDAERVAADEPLCDCCQKPCYPIKADWGGYFCGKCYQYVKRMYCKLADVRTELASVTARLAAAEEKLSCGILFRHDNDITICKREGDLRFHVWSFLRQAFLTDESGAADIYETYELAIAAAVSAGWMRPLGDNTKETT